MSEKGLVFNICVLLFLLISVVSSDPIRNSTGLSSRGPRIEHIRNRHGDEEVVVDNGIIRVSFSDPQGLITGIKYKRIDNVLNPHLSLRGYWDITWEAQNLDRVEGTKFRIITHNEEQVEISFSRTWDISHKGTLVPLNVDKRYIIRKNTPGIYTYGIVERLRGWPAMEMGLIRIVFKLNPKKFDYMAVSDLRQRSMPTDEDRDIQSGHARKLDYKEAVLMTNPKNPAFKNEVDDKYQYSSEVRDNKVHGWISTKTRVGFWIISPSGEYRCGGPFKQELTSHVGPTSISTFISEHYAGEMVTQYGTEEAWKKVLGPLFIYLNSASSQASPRTLWEDAKRQMQVEVENWPFDFVASTDFPHRRQRATVTGQLQVIDRFEMPGKFAFVGLAPPGEAGSWQTNTKDYQFWTEANEKGDFTIKNVRPGTYSLYAWVPGFIGDFKYPNDITVTPGSEIQFGRIVYVPPRNGPTLWEIGIPDRTAREFYVPEPYRTMVNRLYLNDPDDKFRQYGLWQRYTELYPNQDLIYTIGTSNHTKDWFYAQVTRKLRDGTYAPTTWRIVFDLPKVNWRGRYTLRLALASASLSTLQVWINRENTFPLFSTGMIGRDNAIARHGIHGLYRLYSVDVPARLLRPGTNTIYLRQAKATGPFVGLMYDYIRLEGPSTTSV